MFLILLWETRKFILNIFLNSFFFNFIKNFIFTKRFYIFLVSESLYFFEKCVYIVHPLTISKFNSYLYLASKEYKYFFLILRYFQYPKWNYNFSWNLEGGFLNLKLWFECNCKTLKGRSKNERDFINWMRDFNFKNSKFI